MPPGLFPASCLAAHWQAGGRLPSWAAEDCIPARYFTVRQGLANGRGRPAVDRLQRRDQTARAARQGSQAGGQGGARFVASCFVA